MLEETLHNSVIRVYHSIQSLGKKCHKKSGSNQCFESVYLDNYPREKFIF